MHGPVISSLSVYLRFETHGPFFLFPLGRLGLFMQAKRSNAWVQRVNITLGISQSHSDQNLFNISHFVEFLSCFWSQGIPYLICLKNLSSYSLCVSWWPPIASNPGIHPPLVQLQNIMHMRNMQPFPQQSKQSDKKEFIRALTSTKLKYYYSVCFLNTKLSVSVFNLKNTEAVSVTTLAIDLSISI